MDADTPALTTGKSYMNHPAFDEDFAESIASTTRSSKVKDPLKRAWCQTQWTSLSYQAEALGILDVYFDHETRLLDKLTNKALWKLVNQLYDLLGPEKAPFAHPVMLKEGRVEWHNYADNCRGVVAEIVQED